MELQQESDDATNDTNLDEVRTIPAASTASPTAQEEAMICDVQRLLTRMMHGQTFIAIRYAGKYRIML